MTVERDEMRRGFDEAIDRRGTGSLKWDGLRKSFGVEGEDYLPMWVADTEFRVPAPVIEALAESTLAVPIRCDLDVLKQVVEEAEAIALALT